MTSAQESGAACGFKKSSDVSASGVTQYVNPRGENVTCRQTVQTDTSRFPSATPALPRQLRHANGQDRAPLPGRRAYDPKRTRRRCKNPLICSDLPDALTNASQQTIHLDWIPGTPGRGHSLTPYILRPRIQRTSEMRSSPRL